MKKIGVIGGSGPAASAFLYELLVEEVYHQNVSMPEIIIINYPFTNDPDAVWNSDEVLVDKLKYCCNKLLACDVEKAILACNTLHYYLSKLSDNKLEFLQLPRVVLERAENKKLSSLLILGSGNTCQYDLYDHPHIDIVYPLDAEQKLINNIIDRIVRKGAVLQDDSLLLSALITQMSKAFVFDAIVLACTDFYVLHHRFPLSTDKLVLDSLVISAEEMVQQCKGL